MHALVLTDSTGNDLRFTNADPAYSCISQDGDFGSLTIHLKSMKMKSRLESHPGQSRQACRKPGGTGGMWSRPDRTGSHQHPVFQRHKGHECNLAPDRVEGAFLKCQASQTQAAGTRPG